MKIIVPIKQVPEAADIRFKDDGSLALDGVPRILNPFDELAAEAAIQLKEKFGGEVTIITVGPEQAKEAVWKALAMGGDSAIHLNDPAFEHGDTLAIARTLAEQIKKMDYDLIICGKQAIDWDAAQVGPQLAEFLDIPQICGVRHLEVEGDEVTTHRETDDGYEVVKAKMPVLLTATKGLNEPRLPNIMGIMKAKKKPLEVIDLATLGASEDIVGAKGSATKVLRMYPPEQRKGGVKLEDVEPKEAAKQLVEFLTKKGAI
jgi:electron transfer flavoprotein beta subunit